MVVEHGTCQSTIRKAGKSSKNIVCRMSEQNVISGSGGFDGIGKPLLILAAYAVSILLLSIIVYRRKMKQ